MEIQMRLWDDRLWIDRLGVEELEPKPHYCRSNELNPEAQRKKFLQLLCPLLHFFCVHAMHRLKQRQAQSSWSCVSCAVEPTSSVLALSKLRRVPVLSCNSGSHDGRTRAIHQKKKPCPAQLREVRTLVRAPGGMIRG